MKANSETLHALLMERGIPATTQRIAILEYVQSDHGHPFADTVYQKLREKIPTLSLTTVYNTLRLFCEHGLVRMLPCNDAAGMRFDADLKPHAHFRCDKCGEIFDVDAGSWKETLPGCRIPDGFHVSGSLILLSGLCAECAAKNPIRQ